MKKGINANEKNSKWKGDNTGKSAIHIWVSRRKGKPSKCEKCGCTNAMKYHWANVDHKYRRVLEDYIRLCVNCHRIYDIKKGHRLPNGHTVL